MMGDEGLYFAATKEVEGSERRPALWAKAMVLADGDEQKAKYEYIRLRVAQLAEAHASEASVDEATSMPAYCRFPEVPFAGDEATVVKWEKTVGDKVHRGDELAQLEFNSCFLTIESPADGFLAEIKCGEGTSAMTGDILAVISSSPPEPCTVDDAGPGASQDHQDTQASNAKAESTAPWSNARLEMHPKPDSQGGEESVVRARPSAGSGTTASEAEVQETSKINFTAETQEPPFSPESRGPLKWALGYFMLIGVGLAFSVGQTTGVETVYVLLVSAVCIGLALASISGLSGRRGAVLLVFWACIITAVGLLLILQATGSPRATRAGIVVIIPALIAYRLGRVLWRAQD